MMNGKKWIALCALLLLCGTAFALGWGKKKNLEPLRRQSWGLQTVLNFTLYGGTEEIMNGALAKIKDYEGMLDRNLPAELGRLNARQETKPSAELAGLIQRSLQRGKLLEGALDVTLGQIVELWNFGSDAPHVPSTEELQALLPSTGLDKVMIEDGQVRMTHSDTKLDLGAVAKGFVADQLKDYFLAQGVKAGVIDLGGNVLTFGAKPDGKPWVIGLRDPKGGSESVAYWVFEGSAAIVTSGVYERGFSRQGEFYHHLLDPKSGMPAHVGLDAVTVKAQSAELADGLSTGLFVLGHDRAVKVQEEHFPDVTAVYFGTDGTVRVFGPEKGQVQQR